MCMLLSIVPCCPMQHVGSCVQAVAVIWLELCFGISHAGSRLLGGFWTSLLDTKFSLFYSTLLVFFVRSACGGAGLPVELCLSSSPVAPYVLYGVAHACCPAESRRPLRDASEAGSVPC